MPAYRVGWSWLSAILLMLAAPCLLFPDGWKVLALVVLPLIWIGNRIFTGHFVPRTPYDTLLLGLLVMVLVSLYATYDLTLSLPKISGVLLGVSAFYVVVNLAASPHAAQRVWLLLLIGLALFLGVALVGTNWVSKVAVLQRLSALLPSLLRGLPGADLGFHPAEVGGALTWLLFLPVAALIGWWPQRRRMRVLLGLAGLICLTLAVWLTLLLTQSRSAWLGAIAGGLVLLWLLGRWGRVLMVVGLIAGVAIGLWLGPDRLLPSTATSATSGSLLAPSFADRSEIWSRAVYGLQDFPVTGMGMGMFRYVMPVLYPLFTVNPERDLGHTHNEWLQAGVDLGLIGLAIFVAVQGLGLWLAYYGFQTASTQPLRWMMAGTLAGLMAHSVFSLTDAVALGAKPGIFYWLLLAMTAVMGRLAVQPVAANLAIDETGRPVSPNTHLSV